MKQSHTASVNLKLPINLFFYQAKHFLFLKKVVLALIIKYLIDNFAHLFKNFPINSFESNRVRVNKCFIPEDTNLPFKFWQVSKYIKISLSEKVGNFAECGKRKGVLTVGSSHALDINPINKRGKVDIRTGCSCNRDDIIKIIQFTRKIFRLSIFPAKTFKLKAII